MAALSVLVTAWAVLAVRPVQADSPGVLSGTVYDASSGEPLVGAGVTVLDTEYRARTDEEGKFRLEVAPGTYSLRVAAPTYTPANVQGLQVTAGGLADASTSLNPTGAVIDVLEIIAEAHQASEATQLLERRVAAYVSDNIGAQMIKQSPDSDAADVVQRLPAITVSEDDFIFIRGLGERYSGAMLNGSRLPSTDPDKRVVSLDLFPAEFLDSLSIKKSFSPDLPGDFAGGLVDIRLKEFPEELTYSIGVSTSYDTESTFRDFDSSEGSNLDYFGFGVSERDLPSLFGDDNLSEEATSTDSRQRVLHSSLRNVWEIDGETAPPNFGTKFSIGNTFGPVGFTLATNYSTAYKVKRGRERNSALNSGAFTESGLDTQQIDFATYDESIFETKLGAVMTAGAKISEDHTLSFRGFVNRKADDGVQDGVAALASNLEGQDVFNTQFVYRVDQLGFGQLGGVHATGPVEIDWRTAMGLTTRNEPDRRFVRRVRPQGSMEAPRLTNKDPSLIRLFNDLSEWMSDSAVDFTLPLTLTDSPLPMWEGEEVRLKTGLAYTYRDRSFEQRRFRLNFGRADRVDLSRPVEELLQPINIGVGSSNPFEFREAVDPSDDFDATHEVAATYGLIDVPIIPKYLRLIAGARLEYSLIRTIGLTTSGADASTRIKDVDVMPGANFVYSPREDMNVRFGISQTVSRPEFRELTETFILTSDGERQVFGNSDLVSTDVTSYDLRWEWFLSDAELLSFSFFKKDIPAAIERVAQTTTSKAIDSFRNASASLYGVEIEVRKNLGFLGAPLTGVEWLGSSIYQLDNFSVLGNVSIIRSDANIPQISGEECLAPNPPRECLEIQTNSDRSLQGQADLVLNLALQYDHPDWGTYRILHNYVGETIAAAGVDESPDIYTVGRHQLDFVWTASVKPFDVPLNTKLSVENILNDEYGETQGALVTDSYETGVKFGVGLSYSF